jgi:hypothetical protein
MARLAGTLVHVVNLSPQSAGVFHLDLSSLVETRLQIHLPLEYIPLLSMVQPNKPALG